MQSWTKPTDELIERALNSIRKETERRFFFSRLKNPLWLQPLVERDYFSSPPGARQLPNGQVQHSIWPELEYLRNIVSDVPDQVTDVILGLPKVDNPNVYDVILQIAFSLPGRQSAKLRPKALECVGMDPEYLTYRLRALLVHWTEADEIEASMDLFRRLVSIGPFPNPEGYRRGRTGHTANDVIGSGNEARIENREYQDLLLKGVRPLAEKAPNQVAPVLIGVMNKWIRGMVHPDVLDQGAYEDSSTIWCQRLSAESNWHEPCEETLAKTLTFACEKAFKERPESIPDLDESLRRRTWKLFERIRQHLFALHPTEETKPWIQDLILGHQYYGKRGYSYEFQRLVRECCEYFGADLLPEGEWQSIVAAIKEGPSEEPYRARLGDEFAETDFKDYQRDFQRRQLRPFAAVLTGECQEYFSELDGEADAPPLTDDDYSPVMTWEGGVVTHRSPRSPVVLSALTDEDTLAYINEWDEEYLYPDDWLVEVTIGALAEAFEEIFKASILTDTGRLRFWLDNRDRIARPIYVRAMICAMEKCISETNFDALDESLSFCEWVLEHPDGMVEAGNLFGDQSRERPSWNSSRRAVGDLIQACLEAEVPASTRQKLANLLRFLCTQPDWRLDNDLPVLLDRNDQFTEAINNTRSRALESLIKLGLGSKEDGAEAEITLVQHVLEERFSSDGLPPLTLPERAILGVNYSRMINLDDAWAGEHRTNIFRQDLLAEWQEVFGSFLRYNHARDQTFRILQPDYEFALQTLTDGSEPEHGAPKFADLLGRHLFAYYLTNQYGLDGPDSLLDRFYLKTNNDREKWVNLFDHVGLILQSTGKPLDQDIFDKVSKFFEWRLAAGEEPEIAKFTWWLKAECLSSEWRLAAFHKVLSVCRYRDPTVPSIMIQSETLVAMLPEHAAEVVGCFVKMTDDIGGDAFYITMEAAKPILQAGLESSDEHVRNDAVRARENLLHAGRFDLLDWDDND